MKPQISGEQYQATAYTKHILVSFFSAKLQRCSAFLVSRTSEHLSSLLAARLTGMY